MRSCGGWSWDNQGEKHETPRFVVSARRWTRLGTALPPVARRGGCPLDGLCGELSLKYFAERIAGEYATVVLPAPPDVDPAFWMPDADTMAAYQRADLIFLNGAHYAHWLNKVSLPSFRLVDTSSGFQDRYIPVADRVSHTHGPAGEHTHTDVAFTTWLDFDLAVQHAKAIADAFSRRRPELRETFRKLAASGTQGEELT